MFSAKKALAQKQAELQAIDEQITTQTDKLRALDFDCKSKEDIIAHRDETLEEIKKQTKDEQEKIIADYEQAATTAKAAADEAQDKLSALDKKVKTQTIKLASIKALHKAIKSSIDRYDLNNIAGELSLTEKQLDQIDAILPNTKLPLRSDDIKDLRAQNKENEKRIDETLARYEKRYTTKANRAIYQLMVLALRAELQNILHSIKFSQLDQCLSNLNTMTAKFLKIASDGNQVIAPILKATPHKKCQERQDVI